MKKILIGKADIKTLLEDNYIYVDKTEYIYNLIQNEECYFFVAATSLWKITFNIYF